MLAGVVFAEKCICSKDSSKKGIIVRMLGKIMRQSVFFYM